MLKDSTAFSSFAVPDIEAATTFYRDVLGLTVTDLPEMGLAQIEVAGGQPVMVYPKPDHVPATYTILNFSVDDLTTTVRQLTDRGVSFERYDAFEQDELGIARAGEGPAVAWFKDPAGNILSVMEQPPA